LQQAAHHSGNELKETRSHSLWKPLRVIDPRSFLSGQPARNSPPFAIIACILADIAACLTIPPQSSECPDNRHQGPFPQQNKLTRESKWFIKPASGLKLKHLHYIGKGMKSANFNFRV